MIPFYENHKEDFIAFQTSEMNFPLHLHAQLELVYILKGQAEVTINREARTLYQGDMAVIFPNIVHCYFCEEHHNENNCILLIASPRLTGDFINNTLKWHPQSPFFSAGELPEDVPYAIRQLFLQSRQEEPNLPIYRAYLQIILARMWPLLDPVRNKDTDFYDLTHRVVSYILQNFSQPLTLEETAKQLGVNKFYLSRTFSEKLHTGFNDYLNSVRISHAQDLLSSTDKPITEIAFDCGFESQRTFNRAFLKACSMSPREYRNRK